MRYRFIEVFYSVFNHGSVTKAARELNVTQPSVSKILSQSESDLDIKLFERINKKMVPTPEAKILFPYAEKIHNNIENLRRVSSNLISKPEGDLNIAATHALGIDYLPEAISQFGQLNSGGRRLIRPRNWLSAHSMAQESFEGRGFLIANFAVLRPVHNQQ